MRGVVLLEDVSARGMRNEECPVVGASRGRGGFAGGIVDGFAEEADVDGGLLVAATVEVAADAGLGLLTGAA